MFEDPRDQIVEICHLLASQRLTSATGGNVSVRLADGSCWVTPSSLHKSRVRVEDLVRVDSHCQVLEGWRRPSSETLVHLAIYRALPQALAVVHAHPPVGTGFALACTPVPTHFSTEASAIIGAEVPVIPYGRPSTPELAEQVAKCCHPHCMAYLLANHGVVSWGASLWQAYDVMETLEFYAQSVMAAYALGGGHALPEEETRWIQQTFR